MSSSPARAPNPHPPVPGARARTRAVVRLEPLRTSVQAWAAVRSVSRSAVSLLRAACGAGIGVVDGALCAARRGSERLLWWLGYARVELVDAPKAVVPLRPRKPHPRLIQREAPRVLALPRAVSEDDAVTCVYADGADAVPVLEDAKTTVALRRMGTEDEVTRVASDNVISLSRHRAQR